MNLRRSSFSSFSEWYIFERNTTWQNSSRSILLRRSQTPLVQGWRNFVSRYLIDPFEFMILWRMMCGKFFTVIDHDWPDRYIETGVDDMHREVAGTQGKLVGIKICPRVWWIRVDCGELVDTADTLCRSPSILTSHIAISQIAYTL
jgi:hypothetical protein